MPQPNGNTPVTDVSPCARLLRWLLYAIVLLLPWKLATFVGNGEQPNFPTNGWEWAIFSYPCYFSALLGGLALAAAALVWRTPRLGWAALVPLAWTLPLLAGAAGLVNTTETDYAWQWNAHFAGLASLVLATWWTACNDRKLLPGLLHVLGLVGVMGALHGWYQRIWGFAEMKRLTLEQAAANHAELSEQMLGKLDQTRVFGTFVDPNVFASFLLLCLPFSLLAMHHWGSRFEKPKLGARVMLALGLILFGCALVWSGSRGAAIGAAAGLAAAVWSLPKVHSWRGRWLIPLCAVLLVAGFIALVSLQKSRGGLATASIRLGYYRAAVQMFCRNPVCGVGTGEFFPWYLRLKAPGAEVTRNPHSLYFSLLCQQGVAGGVAALAILLLPWLVSSFLPPKEQVRHPLFLAACSGVAAWTVHSAFQFNELVPGVAYLAGIAMLLAFAGRMEGKAPSRHWRWPALALGALTCCAMCRCPGELLYQQAEILQRQNVLTSAKERYQAASQALSAAPGPRSHLQSLALTLQDWTTAETAARELVRCTPHRASSHLRLAKTLLTQGKAAEAETEAVAALTWYPFDPDTLLHLAYLQAMKTPAVRPLAPDAFVLAAAQFKPQLEITQTGYCVTTGFPQHVVFFLNSANLHTQDGQPVRFAASP
ncbi:MAG: O-antigen ligase family protein [Victivallales bacterium]|nr:O-antigen ligase family protein [Victivallales bacterium]